MQMKQYTLGKTIIQYLISEDKNVSMLLLPLETDNMVKELWNEEKGAFDPRARHIQQWSCGSIAHFHVSGTQLSNSGRTMKFSLAEQDMKYHSQKVVKSENETKLITELNNEEGFRLIHTLTYIEGLRGFQVETEFANDSSEDVTLEMLTSFSLDNLSPFQEDDAPNCYNLHRFYGGWSLEGKHSCVPIEELSLEKSWWGVKGQSEKFGNIGSYPVNRYFPTAAFEDKEAGVIWAAQLVNNSAWQMELTRCGDTLSFSGGLGDNDFNGWSRTLQAGESFKAPKAYIATVKGDISDACAALCDMQKPAYEAYGEKELAISFNEYCATWGRPTQDKMRAFSNSLKDFGIKYIVIDAGWSKEGCEQDGNGEWKIDTNIFPDMKALNAEIRKNGMIPGIWFEFEVTTEGSPMFEKDYDEMHLKHNGIVIKTDGVRSYWDFRREDVQKYLKERVIDFLKEYDFGYIKIDFNADIGKEIDGVESGAENLRYHMELVREFFKKIKEEIPDIIIENCASGGHRSEPSMLGVSAVTSFSDVHEGNEIPYVAANLHNLMLPAQELIWAVLREDDSCDRIKYSLAATFLGRVCLSGRVDLLDGEQKEVLKTALEFYRKLDNVIINGDTKIYGNRGRNMRYPTGTQVVVRKTENEILVVCHAFENPSEMIEIDIPDGFEIKDEFYNKNITVKGNKLIVNEMKEFTAEAVLIKKSKSYV